MASSFEKKKNLEAIVHNINKTSRNILWNSLYKKFEILKYKYTQINLRNQITFCVSSFHTSEDKMILTKQQNKSIQQ